MGIPELFQTAFLIICSAVGWAIRQTLQEELRPIKEDTHDLKNSFNKMVELLQDHVESKHPHSVFEETLSEKYVTREEFELLMGLKEKEKVDQIKVCD